jgi:hypothetical protein
MQLQIIHSFQGETIEAKARWFQSLSMLERAEILDSFADLILELNPKIVESKNAQPVKGRILVVRQTPG